LNRPKAGLRPLQDRVSNPGREPEVVCLAQQEAGRGGGIISDLTFFSALSVVQPPGKAGGEFSKSPAGRFSRIMFAMPDPLHIPEDIDISEFISREAHDLKSPFNRILGFIKLVLKGMDGPISEMARDDLVTAYTNGLGAMLMVSSLVEMTRLSRGERKLAPAAVEAQAVVRQALAEWQRVAPKVCPVSGPFGGEAGPGEQEPVAVWGDEALLRQGLLYWILYVLEYTPEGAGLRIEVQGEPGRVVFQVSSQGKKTLPPAESELTMFGYIARKILELHQGELLRAVETGQGAEVAFALPTPPAG
jgi:K+-sensing histidine kinase KdpD